jgi:REP element-mobilizing transposase RayT
LRRIHGGGNFHFITTSCYLREPLLGGARARDIFLRIFEQVRKRYEFEVMGFVVTPEHIKSRANSAAAHPPKIAEGRAPSFWVRQQKAK